MAFDAVSHNKPCAYINYNSEKGDATKWNIEKIYKFIHFKSMQSKDAVLWVNTKEDYSIVLDEVLKGDFTTPLKLWKNAQLEFWSRNLLTKTSVLAPIRSKKFTCESQTH